MLVILVLLIIKQFLFIFAFKNILIIKNVLRKILVHKIRNFKSHKLNSFYISFRLLKSILMAQIHALIENEMNWTKLFVIELLNSLKFYLNWFFFTLSVINSGNLVWIDFFLLLYGFNLFNQTLVIFYFKFFILNNLRLLNKHFFLFFIKLQISFNINLIRI